MIVYQQTPVITEGSTPKTMVTDMTAQGILYNVLKELKKINIYNSLITDEEINNTDIEE